MHITKVPNSYDDYKVELSWSELKAVESALSKNHAGVVADETFARMQYYMARIPGPGEEKEKGDDNTLEQNRAKESLKAASDTDVKDVSDQNDINLDDIPLPGDDNGGESPKPKPQKPSDDISIESIPMPRRSFFP